VKPVLEALESDHHALALKLDLDVVQLVGRVLRLRQAHGRGCDVLAGIVASTLSLIRIAALLRKRCDLLFEQRVLVHQPGRIAYCLERVHIAGAPAQAAR